MSGLVAIGVALLSPIEAYEGSLFSVHMVQHLLLMLVAPPLLLGGGPITLTLRVSTPTIRRRLLWVLHSPVVQGDLVPRRRLGALRRGELGMALQHALRRGAREPAAPLLPARDLPRGGPPLLVAGRRRRSLTVADAIPGAPLLPLPGDAAELVPRRRAAERRPVLYPHYVTNLRTWGPTPLEDQQLGGVLMWVAGDLAFLVAMAIVIVAWMRHEERRTARLDERLAAERAARGEEPWTPSVPRGQTGR